MIPTQVIYYPSFDPDERWLRAMLLVTDQVIRIIPNDAGHRDPEYIERLGSVLPDAIRRESPSGLDTFVDLIDLQRLGKVLSHIRDTSPRLDRTEVIVGPSGTITIPGKVSIHQGKLCGALSQLLEDLDLVDDIATSAVKNIGRDDVLVVPAAASDLILSYVADNIARRLGCNTATDAPIAFAVTALDGLVVHAEGRARGSLLSAIIQLEIPLEVNSLTPIQYANLRNTYADIRAAFAEVIADLSSIHQLGSTEDPNIRLRKVLDAARVFHKECEKFRRSQANEQFTRWTPIAIGGLLSFIAALVDQPEVAIGSAAGSFGLSIVQELVNKGMYRLDNLHRQIAGLRHDIINPTQIRRFI